MVLSSGKRNPAFNSRLWLCIAVFFHLSAPAIAQAHPQNSATPLPKLPYATSPLTLTAVNDPATGLAAFSFAGHEVPPVLHVSPGQTLRLEYRNHMSTHSRELCVDGPCTNMTNLHFHGLHVSPQAPQDDAISMMAKPGETLHYKVVVPRDQAPGLYWYHTHPHGESYQQDLDGMSGAIIVDGIERYAPEVRSLRQQVLVLRDAVLQEHDPNAALLRQRVALNDSCAPKAGTPTRLFTVNGVLRPAISIRPGEKQFWRIVNTSPDLYADLQIPGQSMKVIALDGMPVNFHDPARRPVLMDHVFVPPAGRVEAIVTGPAAAQHATLSTLCFNTGPDGDPNPSMVLADLVNTSASTSDTPFIPAPGAPVFHPLSTTKLSTLEHQKVDFVVTFTEDKLGFYINGQKYAPQGPPMLVVPIGNYQHWRVVNQSHEAHPFHIHQVHFLTFASNGSSIQAPHWLDTVNLDPNESIDLLMDFTDPIIAGMSLFHCHLLKHEDKGMMAKILFVPPPAARSANPAPASRELPWWKAQSPSSWPRAAASSASSSSPSPTAASHP
jgi:FtsP/CotA-like multicopper oxidase with cupredoxin domain